MYGLDFIDIVSRASPHVRDGSAITTEVILGGVR